MLRGFAVDHVFAFAADDDLSGHGDLAAVLISNRALVLVAVIEVDRDGRFGDAGLSGFVN